MAMDHNFQQQAQQQAQTQVQATGGGGGCFSGMRVIFGSDGSNNNNNGQNLAQITPTMMTSTAAATATNSILQQDDEKILIQELNNLSFEEREKIYDEVHGVAKTKQETPEFMENCLERLQKEISELSRRKRRALDRAFFLKPALQYDKKFLIMFLRADNYDPFLAANRMARYFTNKIEIFGEEKLVKDITLEDLDEDDMESFQQGASHVLSEKDRSGRTVFLTEMGRLKFKNWINPARYMWYQIMTLVQEDEDVQIHGVVDIIHFVGISGTINSHVTEFVTRGTQPLTNLPYRVSAVHLCYDDERFKPTLSFMQMLCTRYIRLRFRAHFGSNMECLYALMTFGIPRRAIPIDTDGKPIRHIFEKYLKQRHIIEAKRKEEWLLEQKQKQETERMFDSPTFKDVLLGRGRPCQEFAGNRQLVLLVDAEREHHQSLDRPGKTKLSMEIVKKVQSLGGRFLQKTDRGWEEVDDQVAREKVSQTFRTRVSSNKKPTTTILPSDKNETNNNMEDSSEDLMTSGVGRNKRIRYDDSLLDEYS